MDNTNKTRIEYDKTTGNILNVRPHSQYQRPDIENVVSQDFSAKWWELLKTGSYKINLDTMELEKIVI